MNAPNVDAPVTYSTETLAASGFPTISYDVLDVGLAFRSDDCVVRPEDVETYAAAVEDHDPWFFEPGPFGGPIAHPTFLANQALMMRHNHYVVPAGLHARMIYEFVAPIRLGMRVRTRGTLAEKYVRREKPYMVTDFNTASEEGEILVAGRFIQMLFAGDKAPSSGSSRRPEPEPPAFDPAIAAADGRGGRLEAGQALPTLARTLTQRQIDMYSGVRPHSIHTDAAWAQAKGLRTTIAQGMMSTAYISAQMTAAVGEGFVVGGRMDARFLQPVFCGDTLDVTGTVAGFTREGERIRVHVVAMARNQRGEQTLAATASGLCH
jgi:acyl dehydratase